MRFLSLVLSAFFLIANLTYATPTDPVNGQEYVTLKNPQPVPDQGKKIEVIEFFMYHCPACNMIDPALSAWVKKQGDNIIFKRIHMGSNAPENRLFLTLEALGKENALHSEVLKTWHVQHIQLSNDKKNLEWAVKNGIPEKDFLDTYNSFGVTAKLREIPSIADRYQVDSTPTIIIDGRYQTSMALVSKSNEDIQYSELDKETVKVIDALVKKARAGK